MKIKPTHQYEQYFQTAGCCCVAFISAERRCAAFSDVTVETIKKSVFNVEPLFDRDSNLFDLVDTDLVFGDNKWRPGRCRLPV